MIYVKSITEAAGGSASNPTRRDLHVTAGLIYQFELYLPPGSCGLLHVAVYDGAYPLWPSEPGEYFFGDNSLISFPDRYMIVSPQKVLTVASYNTDDTFEHAFQVRIGQVSAEAFIGSFLPNLSMDRMAEELAKAMAEQEAAQEAAKEALITYFTGRSPEDSEAGSE